MSQYVPPPEKSFAKRSARFVQSRLKHRNANQKSVPLLVVRSENWLDASQIRKMIVGKARSAPTAARFYGNCS